MENNFKKSSKCGNSTCVEVDMVSHSDKVIVRDIFENECTYTMEEWRAFIAGVKLDEFDV